MLLCLPEIHYLAPKALLETPSVFLVGKAQHGRNAAEDHRTFDQVSCLLCANDLAVKKARCERLDARLLPGEQEQATMRAASMQLFPTGAMDDKGRTRQGRFIA